MSDDYLWDGSGEPDPEVRRLELLLRRLRHNRAAPQFPELEKVSPRRSIRPLWPALASAAALLFVVAAYWFAVRWSAPTLQVERLSGTPRAGLGRIIGLGRIESTGHLARGDWLETDASSRARIQIGSIGHVEVEPNTRIRLVETRATEQRLALARGKMRAAILAPPRIFFVETPAAVAVDLGCAYTMEVDDSGAGLLHVTTGWVALQEKGRESRVPKDALCAARPRQGPGTPFFGDSSAAFQSALARFDFEGGGANELGILLAESRQRDTLTLWHLLSRVGENERISLYDRIAAFVPPPRNTTREGLLRLNKEMLDYWWDELEWAW